MKASTAFILTASFASTIFAAPVEHKVVGVMEAPAAAAAVREVAPPVHEVVAAVQPAPVHAAAAAAPNATDAAAAPPPDAAALPDAAVLPDAAAAPSNGTAAPDAAAPAPDAAAPDAAAPDAAAPDAATPPDAAAAAPDASSGLLYSFTSTYSIVATPDQVINNDNVAAPGEAGGVGYFNYGINVDENVICYNITLMGVSGEYVSPANTATHIHQAALGKAGPPRLAFANPNGDDVRRNTVGCLKGPFITGIMVEGKDTGEGFHVSQIEQDPSAFMTDTHTVNFPIGAVRGQLVRNDDSAQAVFKF